MCVRYVWQGWGRELGVRWVESGAEQVEAGTQQLNDQHVANSRSQTTGMESY